MFHHIQSHFVSRVQLGLSWREYFLNEFLGTGQGLISRVQYSPDVIVVLMYSCAKTSLFCPGIRKVSKNSS